MRLIDLIQQFLAKAGTQVGNLHDTLVAVRAKYPDLATELDPLIAALELPVDVAGVATAILPEIGSIAVFKFDGREHPSDGF